MMSSTDPERTVTPEEIGRMLRFDRPELIEEWDEEGTTEAHLVRVAANAQWQWEANLVAAAAPKEPVPVMEMTDWRGPVEWVPPPYLPPARYMRIFSIAQALWLATLDDLDHQNMNRPDPDAELLTETDLRSGWFSIS